MKRIIFVLAVLIVSGSCSQLGSAGAKVCDGMDKIEITCKIPGSTAADESEKIKNKKRAILLYRILNHL
ncbi:MAG: hypothetical protein SFU87_14555 [Chitinophagaceae bacterium]|nr:hypothetical protein [Chitinophagaceae bacterium]